MSRRSEFIAGWRDTFPLVIGATPFGLIFGAQAVAVGLSPAAALGMSLFVFAGSAQFIGVLLVGQHTSLVIIVLTTFVVNLRHALYSITLAPSLKHLPQRWLLPLGFLLTDETFVVSVTHFAREKDAPYRHWYMFGSSVFMYLNWNFWTAVGIFASQRVKGISQLGLDFALVVTFIGIVIPLLNSRPMLTSALVAGLVAAVTYSLPNHLGLMVAAVCGIAAGMLVETLHKPRAHTPQPLEQEAR